MPGLGIGIIIDDFQIAGIRHDVTESLKSVVRWAKSFGVVVDAYSCNNLIRCVCHRRHQLMFL